MLFLFPGRRETGHEILSVRKAKGFESLCLFQLDLLRKKQRENELKKQRRIIERMKPVGALPRDIKGFMHRETLPHYIFYDYAKEKRRKTHTVLPASIMYRSLKPSTTAKAFAHTARGKSPLRAVGAADI